MKKLRDEKETILFAISLPQVREFCKQDFGLKGGKLIEMGPVNEVCYYYSEYVDNLTLYLIRRRKNCWMKKFNKRLLPKEEKTRLYGRK